MRFRLIEFLLFALLFCQLRSHTTAPHHCLLYHYLALSGLRAYVCRTRGAGLPVIYLWGAALSVRAAGVYLRLISYYAVV